MRLNVVFLSLIVGVSLGFPFDNGENEEEKQNLVLEELRQNLSTVWVEINNLKASLETHIKESDPKYYYDPYQNLSDHEIDHHHEHQEGDHHHEHQEGDHHGDSHDGEHHHADANKGKSLESAYDHHEGYDHHHHHHEDYDHHLQHEGGGNVHDHHYEDYHHHDHHREGDKGSHDSHEGSDASHHQQGKSDDDHDEKDSNSNEDDSAEDEDEKSNVKTSESIQSPSNDSPQSGQDDHHDHHDHGHHHHHHSHHHHKEPDFLKAHCHLLPNSELPESNVSGHITITQRKDGTGPLYFKIDMKGFKVFKEERLGYIHGFHIHENKIQEQKCSTAGAHFNPYERTHGAKYSLIRHVGDLGNIRVNNKGRFEGVISDDRVAFIGTNPIIGRSIVVHEKADDLGRGENEESLKTGNAGARLACCTIESVNIPKSILPGIRFNG